MKYVIRSLEAGALALVMTGSAAAADFTLEVPVRFANVPSVTSATVDCLISRVEVGGPGGSGGTNVVGRGSASVPVSGGAYDGSVTVEINSDGIIPASDARSYRCSLRAAGTARTGSTYTASPGNFQDVYTTATGATLDSVTTNVQGNLP